NVHQQILLARRGGIGVGVVGGDLFVDRADLGLDGGGVLALALEDADLLGDLLALGLEALLFGLGAAAGFVAGEDVVDEGPVVAPAGLEARADGVGVFADLADVEHGAAS